MNGAVLHFRMRQVREILITEEHGTIVISDNLKIARPSVVFPQTRFTHQPDGFSRLNIQADTNRRPERVGGVA